MASSKVMASSSTSSTKPDLVRQSSTYSQLTIGNLQSDPSKNFSSMNMDDLIRNIYGDNPPPPSSDVIIPTPTPPASGALILHGEGESAPSLSLPRQGSFPPLPKDVGSKTVEEVWKEISGGTSSNNGNGKLMRDEPVEEEAGGRQGGGGGGGGAFNEMTLEEFLTKAGAVGEEDMKIPQMVGPVHGFVVDPALDSRYPPPHQADAAASGSGSILWLGNGGDRAGGGRGKRRAVLEPIDKVAQQRQRRMIKNRESAARSRERKQAYTVELESLVTQLEEENARLQREQVERNQERYKQLMENVIPVEEKQKKKQQHEKPALLRRACSAHW